MIKLFRLRLIKLILFSLITLSCAETKSQKAYFNDLGEIPFDRQLDDINFKVCYEGNTLPFNYGGVGLVYEGQKKELVKTIKDKFDNQQKKGQTGFVTVRFIINCEGKTGRFRMSEMGLKLKSKRFDKNITSQILDITKNLDGWKAFKSQEKTLDYQQYLIFKLENGVLKDVLP